MKRYRQTRILAILEERPAVSVADLSAALGASVGTIRRDLAALQLSGQLRRVHGGAFAAVQGEGGFTWRTCLNMDKKSAVGRAAAAEIMPGSVVFIDGGTTTEAMLPYLAGKTSLTVVTCALNIAVSLLRIPYINTILLGGSVHAESRTVIGPLPVKQMDAFGLRFDAAIISTAGISAEHGATNRMLERLPLKQKVLESCEQSFLISDSSKLDRVYLGRVAPLLSFTRCYIDDNLSNEQKRSLSAAGNFTFVPVPAQKEGEKRISGLKSADI